MSKILFLYTEIAEYVLAGVEALVRKNMEVHIVRYPVNEEAPFKFRALNGVTFYERRTYTDEQLLELAGHIQPDIIIVSGWIDKGYLKTAKYFKKRSITVLSLDNHWNGTGKQRIASLLSPFFIRNKFTLAWVPGTPQKRYALKLHFPELSIYTGFYSADTKLFSEFYSKSLEQKQKHFPKKVLYVGRYIAQKGILPMWQAFIELQNESPTEWELVCAGTGNLYEQRAIHPKITHLGFVQPKDMQALIENSGVYILPSLFEPWGVSVHEMAAAGMPLLCSEQVGAASFFLEEGVNGYYFKENNIPALKSVLQKIMNLPEQKLLEMSKHSVKNSEKISPETWAETVVKMLKQKNKNNK